jgi:hypothetical protein
MPTITPTVERVSQNTVRITYSNMALNDVGAPIGKHWADYADRSVHFSGTFGSNGSVTVEGSNNAGGSYKALTDPQTSAITKTAEAIEQIVEIAELTRPNVTIGDANTAIDVDFYLRRKAEGE